MTRYAAFLRGVNVGGVNLKMAEVAKAFEDAGFTNVRTILASGNVLLDSRAGVDAVRKKAEKALRDKFGYDAWVLAYDIETVAHSLEKYPVRARGRGPPLLRHVRHRRRGARRTRRARQGRPGPTRRSNAAKGVIYWQVPKTGTLDTTIGKTMGKKRYKSSTTTRNLRTLDKVLR